MQAYRWTLTMALSIVHRATGISLYFGTLLLAWWLIAAGAGPNAYARVGAFVDSFIGRMILFAYTWTLIHHMLGGIRHLIWDLGRGFESPSYNNSAWMVVIATGVSSVLIWIVGLMAW